VILVVDDDPRIRVATVQVLAGAGFDVLSAEDGFAALTMIEANARVTTLVTDVLMPGMKGTELAKQAVAVRPDIAILFMSGDIGDTPVSDFGSHVLLRKPFTQAALLAAVRAK
jgi:CheY-like chemotaxis protein